MDNITTIRRFLEGLKYVRLTDAEMPIQYLTGFLTIAVRDIAGNPIETKELSKVLGTTHPSISRMTGMLSKIGAKGKPGLDFIVKEIDIMDQRKKPLRLTPKGKQFLAGLCETASK